LRVIKFEFWISPLVIGPFLPLLDKKGASPPSQERQQAHPPAPAGRSLIGQVRRVAKKYLKPLLARTFRGRSLTAFAAKVAQ
jgi:hypothetical protein